MAGSEVEGVEARPMRPAHVKVVAVEVPRQAGYREPGVTRIRGVHLRVSTPDPGIGLLRFFTAPVATLRIDETWLSRGWVGVVDELCLPTVAVAACHVAEVRESDGVRCFVDVGFLDGRRPRRLHRCHTKQEAEFIAFTINEWLARHRG